jgi:hypothetical protein
MAERPPIDRIWFSRVVIHARIDRRWFRPRRDSMGGEYTAKTTSRTQTALARILREIKPVPGLYERNVRLKDPLQ